MKELIKQIKTVRDKIESLEHQIRTEKNKLEFLEQAEAPILFYKLGAPSHNLESGEFVELQTIYKASKKEELYQWLEENNLDSIIKTEVKAPVPRMEIARKIEMLLEAEGLNPIVDRKVHHSTLSSVISDVVENGTEVPFADIGINLAYKVIIK